MASIKISATSGEQRVQDALAQFLVGTAPDDLAFPQNSPEARNGVFSGKLERHAIAEMIRRGHSQHYLFLVLPNRRSPRWLLSLGSTNEAVAGLEIYQPYTLRGQALKSLFARALRMGWKGTGCPYVLIGSREPLPIEALVKEVTEETEPCFSLGLGEPSAFCKVVVQVMRPSGEILGYLKIPHTGQAGERIRHEVETLRRLAEFPSLRPYIARVLYAGNWQGRYVSFQSPGPMQACGLEFGPIHEEFLQKLRNAGPVRRPGSKVVDEVAARWSMIEPKLDPAWRALGQKALARARMHLGAEPIPCGPAHGDFGPWHARTHNGRIFVFDWEWAAWDAPNLWDVMSFRLGTSGFWNRKFARPLLLPCVPEAKGTWLLYLINSACMSFEGGLSAARPPLAYRRRLIENEL